MVNNQLLSLIKKKQTIFTIKDIALLWHETDNYFVKQKLHRYVKSGELYSVRRGIYAKDKNYDKYELASRIFTPAYISFETVLMKSGIIFQLYNQIFVASYLSRELVVDGQKYTFRKIKEDILTNRIGIDIKNGYFIASPERAFLDTIYLNKDYYFDNLININWSKVLEILPIYGGNKRIEAKIRKYQKIAENNPN